MSIAVYFNTPVNPWPRERMLADIRSATRKVAVASAWFTDMDIARAFVETKVSHRVAILSAADLNRPGSKEVWDYLNAERVKCIPDDDDLDCDGDKFCLVALGSGDFKEGVMHHKIALIDDDITWTGSYNFTFQARRNYENILRIEDPVVTSQFWIEMEHLKDDWILWMGGTQGSQTHNGFRCSDCEKLFPWSEIGVQEVTWQKCLRCSERQ